MTTEREQLELAAKACGYNVKFVIGKYAKDDALGLFMLDYETSNRRSWNPLTDDGDCARMEAKLGIELTWFFDRVDALACDIATVVRYFKDHNNDKNAARRAASMAVAAEIGRMK